MANGFAALGDLLGGGVDRETPYYEGMYEGSRAQKALAEARIKRDEAVERVKVEETLRASGIKDPAVLANVMRGGFGNFQQATAGLGNLQEQDFRGTAADPSVSPADANVALRGVASGPVDRFQSVGEGLFADLFGDAAAPTVSPIGESTIGQRDASARYSDERSDFVGPLADALIGQRNASAALSDERRMHPEKFRSPGATVNIGQGLGDLLAGEPTQTTVPGSLSQDDFSKSTGLEGLVRRGVNIGGDIIPGLESPFPSIDAAQNVLEDLSVRTETALAGAAQDGRMSNYLLQRFAKLSVDPGDLMRGDTRAWNRFKQTRMLLDGQIQALQQRLNNPVGLSKTQISKDRVAFDELRNVLADYEAVLQFDPNSEQQTDPASELPQGWTVTEIP